MVVATHHHVLGVYVRSFAATPLNELTADDINGLIGWSESTTLEFKATIPSKEQSGDGWLSGGKVGDYGRDKLLKEVVAFANTSGGRVVLGVEEERGPPPTAKAIAPIRDCMALAGRLLQMAQHIEPPIPMLQVRGIPVNGEAGVVVLDVPASRAAPHRAPNKECYVRRATESAPVTMREIQDMTLAAARREEWLPSRLATARAEFQAWMRTQTLGSDQYLGIRVTGAPAAFPFSIPRFFGDAAPFRSQPVFILNRGGTPLRVSMTSNPERLRPVLRGVRIVDRDKDTTSSISLFSDGCVSVNVKVPVYSKIGPRLYFWHILPCVLNAVRAAEYLRQKSQSPDAEYVFETELNRTSAGTIGIHSWGGGFDDPLGDVPSPTVLPYLCFGALTETCSLVEAILTDVKDAAGCHLEEPLMLSGIHEFQ